MFNFRKLAAFFAATVLITAHLTAGTVFAADDDKKITICHATSSNTNTYVRDTIAVAAVLSAHIEHQDDEDIIPEFTYKGKTYSQNWNANGQAIWNHDCKAPQPTDNNPPSVDQVTLCHATGSSTNPFVVDTVDVAGAYNGHMGHQNNEDIIPPFTYQGTQYSLNWTAAGQAAWNNNCVPAGGMGSGPTDPGTPAADPQDPAAPTAPTATTTPQLANTGSDIWISSLISLAIIAISTVLGFASRRKLTVA